MAGAAKPKGIVLLLVVAAAVLGWWWQERAPSGSAGGAGYRWVEHPHNDGDSFHIRTPEGKEQEVRLYFVDAPESALKTYANGENNHQRVADQARALRLTRELFAAAAAGGFSKFEIDEERKRIPLMVQAVVADGTDFDIDAYVLKSQLAMENEDGD
jgi:hypothetical protein